MVLFRIVIIYNFVISNNVKDKDNNMFIMEVIVNIYCYFDKEEIKLRKDSVKKKSKRCR